MNQASRLDEKLLKRRKAMVTGMVALTVLVLVGFIAGSWQFLQDMGDYLEDELGTRLLSVASLTARIVESSDFAINLTFDQMELGQHGVSDILNRIHKENQLQGVYLVDLTNHVITSSRNLLQPGDTLPFLAEDSSAINKAISGIAAVAPMQILAGDRFKSAYAPVMNPFNETMAVIVVQANAGFFELLGQFQRGLILTGAVSITIAVLFSVFLYWAIKLLVKTHDSLRKSERLAAMGQMAATVAHEIRNPLGIIKGTADVLTSKYNTAEEPDELFEYIPSEVRRLNRLVSDFLTFARDRDLETNATDLQASVEKSLISLKDEIQNANVEIEEDFEKVPEVNHDEDAINQLLLNLSLNSVQAMPDGGKLFIRLKNDDRKKGRSYVRVEVEDTGCGFDVDSEKIFEPFYTTKTSGSGLGLTICKRLVEKHGGWIDVESEKNVGTKMRFYLPVN